MLIDRYFVGVSGTQSIFNLGKYFMMLLTRMAAVVTEKFTNVPLRKLPLHALRVVDRRVCK